VRSAAFVKAVDFLARTDVAAVRLHAARTLGQPRKFGPLAKLREDAERDMLTRDVRELFLLPYAEAMRTTRLRGPASGICGRVLSSNASVALEALIARGSTEAKPPLSDVLDGMRSRSHPFGFFYEPYQADEALGPRVAAIAHRFVCATAVYTRILLAYGWLDAARTRAAFDWLVEQQDEDGAWRPPLQELRGDETRSYVLTRAVAEAFCALPAATRRRWAEPVARLAATWSDRILARFDAPDAVLAELNIDEDPRGPARGGHGPEIAEGLLDRMIYFPLEDLALALAIGADANHPHLAPWIDWLERSQRGDGSWRLRNPTLRERLLLSDPNGRLRAEALYLTDEWITLRAAQILRFAGRRARPRVPLRARVPA
jgi:hypothetical protein